MRRLSLTALIVAIAMLALSLGVAVNEHNRHHAAAERTMDGEAATHASLLDASMDRARTITLVVAHNAAFRGFYLQPGSRASKLRPGSTYVDGANDALVYLESLFPTQIGELCFIDHSGSENARVVHGRGPPSPTSRPTRRATRSSAPPSPCGPARCSSHGPTCRPTRTTG